MERGVKIWLEIKPKNIGGAKAAFKDMMKDLNKHEAEMNRVVAQAASPTYIRQMAGIQFKQNRAQGAIQSGMAKEMAAIGNTEKFGATLGPMVTQFAGLAAAAGPAVIAVGATVGAFAALGAAAVKFGGMANPYALERLNLATDDLMAVFGRVFVPILGQMEKGTRLLGDTLATILPTEAEMAAIFQELEPVWAELRDVMVEIAPLIKDALIPALQAMGKAAERAGAVAKPSKDAAGIIAESIIPFGGLLRRWLGEREGKRGLADSTGASIHGPASYFDIAGLGKSNLQMAYSSGPSDAARTAAAAEATAQATRELADRQRQQDEQRGGRRAVDGHG